MDYCVVVFLVATLAYVYDACACIRGDFRAHARIVRTNVCARCTTLRTITVLQTVIVRIRSARACACVCVCVCVYASARVTLCTRSGAGRPWRGACRARRLRRRPGPAAGPPHAPQPASVKSNLGTESLLREAKSGVPAQTVHSELLAAALVRWTAPPPPVKTIPAQLAGCSAPATGSFAWKPCWLLESILHQPAHPCPALQPGPLGQ